MYSDQVMDNLVRAHSGLPFVQLAYRDLFVSDDDTLSGTASVEQDIDTKRGGDPGRFPA